MTAAVVERQVEAPGTLAPRRRASLKDRLFAPGWPLAWLFVGYPLWWIMGITEAMTFILAAAMGIIVLRRRPIYVPRGFGFWLLFLVWCAVGVLLLQVDAPGAVPGYSSGRYAVWAFRTTWYLASTLVLLYVGTSRRDLPLAKVARILSWMFVTVVVGGVAGVLWPQLDFPSVIELVLPHSITNINFVQQMVHPNLAQIQRVLGYQEARPSAPFSYTNTWGLALACFLPFFVVSWFGKDAGWRRIAGPLVLAAALVPVIQSLNRGLWGALVGMAVFVAIRYALMGRVRLFVALVVGVVAVGVVIAVTPLSSTVSARWQNQHSNEGRTNLSTLAVTSAATGSPVVGFGTTRDVQGNFSSIAGGATEECPKCSPPSLGTQGQAWLLTFTTGFGGLLFYVLFFAVQVLRGLRLRSDYVTVGLTVLVAHVITMVVYNANGPGLLAIMVGVAFLWREAMDDVGSRLSGPRRAGLSGAWPTLGGYATLLRRNSVLLLVIVIAGTVAGLGALHKVGIPVASTVSISLGDEPTLVPGLSPLTIDSDAQYVGGATVQAAIARESGGVVDPNRLSVSAVPNSTVLRITYTAGSTKASQTGAVAAANGFLTVREARLAAERARVVSLLEQQVEAARRGITQSQTIVEQLRLSPSAASSKGITLLNANVDRQITELGRLSVRYERAKNQKIDAGSIIAGPASKPASAATTIVGVSSALLALLLGLGIALARDRRSPRLRSPRSVTRETGLPVVAVVPADLPVTDSSVRPLAQAMAARGALACVAAGGRARVRALSSTVDRAISHEDNALGRLSRAQTGLRPGVVIVVDRRTRAREALSAADLARGGGSTVLGVVFVRSPRPAALRSSVSPPASHGLAYPEHER